MRAGEGGREGEDGRQLLGSKNWLYVGHAGCLGVEQEHFCRVGFLIENDLLLRGSV